MADLPTLSGCPECPAAFPIAGAVPVRQGVVCRVMERDVAEESGVGMSAGRLGYLQHEATGGVYLNLGSDPSSVLHFCYGRALARSTESDEGPRAHHTFCPVFEAWWERSHAGEDGLYDVVDPETVAMGIEEPEFDLVGAASSDAGNPWAQARRDLDVLVPPEDLAA